MRHQERKENKWFLKQIPDTAFARNNLRTLRIPMLSQQGVRPVENVRETNGFGGMLARGGTCGRGPLQ